MQKKGPRTPKFEVLEKKRKSPSEKGSPDAQATKAQEPSEARDPTDEQESTADTEPHTPSPQPHPTTEAINPTSSLAISDTQPSELPALLLTPRKRHSDSFREIANSQASEASNDSFYYDSQQYPDFDDELGSAALTTPEARSVGWRSSPVLGGFPELEALGAEQVERRGSLVVGEELPLISVNSMGEPEVSLSPSVRQPAERPQILNASSRPKELPGLHPTESQAPNITPLERGGSPLIGEEMPAVTGINSGEDPESSISPPLIQEATEPSTAEGLQAPDTPSRLQELPSLHPAEEAQNIDAASVPSRRLLSPRLMEKPQVPITDPQSSQRLPSLRPRRPATRSKRSQKPTERDRTETSPTPDTAPQPSQQLSSRDKAETSSIPDTAPQPSQQFPIDDGAGPSLTPDTSPQPPQQLPRYGQSEASSTPDTAPQPSQHLPVLHMETEGPPTSMELPVPESAPRNNKRPNDVTTTPPKKRARHSLPKTFAIPPWKRADSLKGSSSAPGADRTRRVSRSGISRTIPARSEEEEMAQVVAEASRASSLGRTTRSGLVHGKVSKEEIEAAFPDPDPDPEFGRIDGGAAEMESPASFSTGKARTSPLTEDNVERKEDEPMLPPPRPVPEEHDEEGAVSDGSSYTNVMSTPLRDYGRDFTSRSGPCLISVQNRTPASKRTPTAMKTPASNKSSVAKSSSTRAGVKKSGSKTRSYVSKSTTIRMAELPTSSAADSVTDTSASKVSTPPTTPDVEVPKQAMAPPDDDNWVPKKMMPPPDSGPMIPLPTMGRARRNKRVTSTPSVPFGTPLSSRPGARAVRGDWRGSVKASRTSGGSPANGWASKAWGSSPKDAPPQTPTPANTTPANSTGSRAEADEEPYFAVDTSSGRTTSARPKAHQENTSVRTPASAPQRRTGSASGTSQTRLRTRSAARTTG